VDRDDVAPSRWQRILNASWPLFQAFGVEVRVHWTILVVPFAFFSAFSGAGGYGTSEAVGWALAWTFALYFSVWVHEMGHVSMGRRFGVPSRLVTLSPLGGLAHLEAPAPTPRAEIWTALAGPMAQAAFLAVAGIPWLVAGDALRPGVDTWASMYRGFLLLQVTLIAFNLLPCHPLDGGRVLRGFLAQRMHPNRASIYAAYAGFAGAIVIGLAGIAVMAFVPSTLPLGRYGGLMLLLLGINNFLHSRQLLREAQYMETPYEGPVEAWKTGHPDADAWKSGHAETERLARAEERRERRAAEARRQEEEHRRRVQERVDQLLDRINEVGGVENLSPSERRELAEASELLRREAVQ
jgi:Zn-dependent protease